jgi:acetylornithine deacetylase/succinyl-diaminopimelate desuccinylase-like protein
VCIIVNIDWSDVRHEAEDVFVRYLQIDSSNPPGRETPAAQFLGELLEKEGITPEYIEIKDGRKAVFARLKGSTHSRSLMLASHTDVVPARKEDWTVDPFGGEIIEGKIYGRGAVDMKSVTIFHLFCMILIKRFDIPLSRDLVFLSVPDEETGSRFGMKWLIDNRPELFDCEFSLNEGASGLESFTSIPLDIFQVAVSEKRMAPFKLTVKGTPGHGSKPTVDNPIVHLVEACEKLVNWKRDLDISEQNTLLVRTLADKSLINKDFDFKKLRQDGLMSPDMEAGLTNTINLTIFNSGFKFNVIPGSAEALFDCRLLPEMDLGDWQAQVESQINDDRIVFAYALEEIPNEPDPVISEWGNELSVAIENSVKDFFEDAVVSQTTSTVGTDNRFLRTLGIPSYGFIPCLFSQAELDGFHANDEFLTQDNFKLGVKLMWSVVAKVVCAK